MPCHTEPVLRSTLKLALTATVGQLFLGPCFLATAQAAKLLPERHRLVSVIQVVIHAIFGSDALAGNVWRCHAAKNSTRAVVNYALPVGRGHRHRHGCTVGHRQLRS